MKSHRKDLITLFLIVYLIFSFFSGCTKKAKLTSLGLVISSVTVVSSSITSSSATVTWTTDVAATSKAYYRTSGGSFTSTPETDTGANRTKTHSVTITGLNPSTLYYVYVESKDSNSNSAKSGEYSFTTTGTGPTISAVSASATANSATITWTTSEDATSQVFYGTTPSFSSSTTETTTFNTSHAVTLTGLTTNTVYYYYVKSKNSQGNSSTSGDDGSRTFTTSSSSTGTTLYLYFDDIKIEGTGGTPVTIYDDTFSSSIFTGGNNNNIAYMGDSNFLTNIQAMDAAATDDKHGGSVSWKITLGGTTQTGMWAGMYVLASGAWRANWTGTESAANLSGPTGTVKLTCWAKVSAATNKKFTIGIGDDSGTSVDDSITGGKKESPKFTLDTTWKQLELDLTGQSLTSINGPFFWAIKD